MQFQSMLSKIFLVSSHLIVSSLFSFLGPSAMRNSYSGFTFFIMLKSFLVFSTLLKSNIATGDFTLYFSNNLSFSFLVIIKSFFSICNLKIEGKSSNLVSVRRYVYKIFMERRVCRGIAVRLLRLK